MPLAARADWFRLQAGYAAQSDVVGTSPSQAARWVGGNDMVSVLVVATDEATRSLAALALQEHGFEALVARNGIEALAWLAGAMPIDVLFTDLELDGMSGIELGIRARHLRADLRILYTSDPYRLAGVTGVLTEQSAFLPRIYSVTALIDAVSRMAAAGPPHRLAIGDMPNELARA